MVALGDCAVTVGVAQASRLVAVATARETDEGYQVLSLERIRIEDAAAAGDRIQVRFEGRYDRVLGAWVGEELVKVLPSALGVPPKFVLTGGVGVPAWKHTAPYLEELIEAGRLSFDVEEDEERAFWRQLRPREDDLDAIAHDETVVAVALAVGLVVEEEDW